MFLIKKIGVAVLVTSLSLPATASIVYLKEGAADLFTKLLTVSKNNPASLKSFAEAFEIHVNSIVRPMAGRISDGRIGLAAQKAAISFNDELLSYSVVVNNIVDERSVPVLRITFGKVITKPKANASVPADEIGDLPDKINIAIRNIQSTHRGNTEESASELRNLLQEAAKLSKTKTSTYPAQENETILFLNQSIDLPLSDMRLGDLEVIHNLLSRAIGTPMERLEMALAFE